MSFISRIWMRIKEIIVKEVNRFRKRDIKLWVFGEWFGKRCGDNAAYFANYVAEHSEDIKIIWVAESCANTSMLNSKIQLVERDSEEAIYYYKRAGVAIMGQGFGDFSSYYNYLAGALTVNLWHGVPWKKIGFDGMRSKGIVNKLHEKYFDYMNATKMFLASSDEYGKAVKSSFGIKEANIIYAGQPRNSIFYDEKKIQTAREKILGELKEVVNFTVTDKLKIITYMPTFRDKIQDSFSFRRLVNNEVFVKRLEADNIVIIQKAHFVNEESSNKNEGTACDRIVDMNKVDTQYLLAATDLLVTDYSSCFFDYLILDRPIVHYIYDYEYYKNKDRGLYYEKEDVLCGSEAQTEEELINAIWDNIKNPLLHADLRKKRRQIYINYEDSESCKKIFEEIKKVMRG